MSVAEHSTVGTPRARLRELVHDHIGITLPESKDSMIEQRLRKRVLDLGASDFDSYLDWLFEGDGLQAEWAEIVDLLTTHKTDFFREAAHFDYLVRHIVPQRLASAASARPVRFRVWSAASSNGAEAWTLAMLLAQSARSNTRLDWAVLGTDVSQRVVDEASRAVYTAEELRPVPKDLSAAYLMRGQRDYSNFGRFVPELRARVRFEQMNLMQTPYPVQSGLDVVLLRNVLIYFEPDIQARVIAATAAHLRPGGYLIVGHAESMVVRARGLEPVIPGVFRKQGDW